MAYHNGRYTPDWLRITETVNDKADLPNSTVTKFTKVCQYTEDGQLIACFPSIIQASEMTGIKKSNILQNITGRTYTAGGYIWKKAEGRNE